MNRILLACLVELWVLLCTWQQDVLITTEPLSANASVGSKVFFNCSAKNADLFIWSANGSDINYLDNIKKDIAVINTHGEKEATLEIWPTQQTAALLNGTYLSCKATALESGTVSSANSSNALLLLQGIVSAPSHLTALPNCSNGTLGLSWIAPYTLDGIEIIQFSVNMDNGNYTFKENFGRVYIPLPSITRTNVSNDNLSISVRAKTAAGFSNFTSVAINITLSPQDITKGELNHEVMYNGEEKLFQVLYMITESNICRIPNVYKLEVTIDKQTQTFPINDGDIKLDEDGGKFIINFDIGLVVTENGKEVQIVDVSIESRIIMSNSAGRSTSEKVEIGIFHTEKVDTNGENATCTFVNGSNALGCQAVTSCSSTEYEDTSLPSNETCNITRTDDTSTSATGGFICGTPLQCKEYDVKFYDIFSDGKVGTAVASELFDVVIQSNIPLFTPTPSTSVWVTPSPTTKGSNDIWITAVVIGVFVLFLIALTVMCIVCIRCRRKKPCPAPMSEESPLMP